MKNYSVSPLKSLLAGLALCMTVAAGTVSAAVLYWDPQANNSQFPYTGNMAGSWESALWSPTSAGEATPANWTNSDAACFGVNTGLGTPAFAVSMNGNHTVAGIFDGPLNPNSCNVTIYGSGIMTLAPGLNAFAIHNASDGSLGIVTVSNTIAGTGILNPQEEGQLYLYGSNTWTGGTSLGYSGNAWEGTVYFNTTNAFGAGPIIVSNCLGGALVLTGSSPITITNGFFFPTFASATLSLVGNPSALTFSGPWTNSLSCTLNVGTANAGGNQVFIAGPISGAGGITITNSTVNAGVLTLGGNDTYKGNTTVGAGSLAIGATGSISNTPTIFVESAGTFDVSALLSFNINANQTLDGFGSVNGDVSVGTGAKIVGGTPAAIGTLTDTGSVLLQSGGTDVVYVQNAVSGAGIGNSTMNVGNAIGVLATSANPFTIKLVSIAGTGAAGMISNFDRTMSYTWTVASGTVTNFDPGDFVVDTSAFANLTIGGEFSVSNTGSALVVNYTPQTNVIISAQVPTNDFTLYVGQYYTLSVTAGGEGPLFYQWFTNGVADTTAGTNPVYPLTSVQLGQSGTTYQCIVTNDDSAATNLLVTLTVLPWPSTTYQSNLLSLQPVAYWPMHEMEAPAQGDIETNYGTLGALANGYYPDWASRVTTIQRGASSAILGDPDTAVYFTNSSSGITNALYVPHVSPVTTLTPPFSVECWFYPTNSSANDIWSQNGFEGVNAGNSGAGNGGVCGIRLYAGGNGITVYTYKNSSTLHTPVSCTNQSTGSWVYIVLTCDSGTNISLYTNGVLASTAGAAASLYAPDYWTPFEVGNGRGNTRACAGIIDEVAIYTNVLQAGDITAHYADGLGGVAGQYFADVMASNPAVYLRMDASAYTPPAVDTWPILTNYGIVAGNGLYSPGTVPGIVTGPNTNGYAFSGFTNLEVAFLSGVSSFADAGYQQAFNPIGPTPFAISAIFRGNPCDNRVQEIVGHSSSSWGLVMSTNGTVQCQLGTNTASLVISTNVLNDGNWHQVVDVYSPNSSPTGAGTNALYVDGILNKLNSSVTPNGILPGSTQDVFIGSDPQYTNNPAGIGRQFSGQICDVALFTNALTATEIQQLYALTVPVIMTVNPGSTNIVFSTTNNILTLSWPADHIGWTLQAQTNSLDVGIGTNWVNVAGSSATNQVVIPVDLSNGCVFYRLVYHP